MWCCNLMIAVLVAILLCKTAAAAKDHSYSVSDDEYGKYYAPQSRGKKTVGQERVPMLTREELLSIIDSSEDLDPDEKEILRADLLQNIREEPLTIKRKIPLKLNQRRDIIERRTLYTCATVGALLIVIAWIFVKINKYSRFKERQREEKKKIKIDRRKKK